MTSAGFPRHCYVVPRIVVKLDSRGYACAANYKGAVARHHGFFIVIQSGVRKQSRAGIDGGLFLRPPLNFKALSPPPAMVLPLAVSNGMTAFTGFRVSTDSIHTWLFLGGHFPAPSVEICAPLFAILRGSTGHCHLYKLLRDIIVAFHGLA
jgi:hypothetical protein